MDRIQYEQFMTMLYLVVEVQCENSTREGSRVYKALSKAMFQFHPQVVAAKKRWKKAETAGILINRSEPQLGSALASA